MSLHTGFDFSEKKWDIIIKAELNAWKLNGLISKDWSQLLLLLLSCKEKYERVTKKLNKKLSFKTFKYNIPYDI